MNQEIKILLVDDHPIFLDGIYDILSAEKWVSRIFRATSVSEALDYLRYQAVDLVLTDINLPDGSGLDILKEIRIKHKHLKVLAFSMVNEKAVIASARELGAHGYLMKDIEKKELIDSLLGVLEGKEVFSEKAALSLNSTDKRVANLTNRELEIIKLIEQEYSNAKIAGELFISERTVETHRKNIFRKTETSSVVGLVKYAYKHDLI